MNLGVKNLWRNLGQTFENVLFKKINHGNLRGPPQCHPPPRNKALLRDYILTTIVP